MGATPVPSEMQALVYRGVNDVRIETVPVPQIRSGEVLVKVAVCGICPTDIKKIQYGTVPPPRIFGHETAGTIAKLGSQVRSFRVGDRVALHHHVPCLKCPACAHRSFAQCAQYKRTGITAGFEPAGGGYAEYVRVMPFVFPGIVKIPARNTFEEGAMVEPVNTVLKAVKRLSLLRGDNVLVAGQGPIGLMFTEILSRMGHGVLATDLVPDRLRMSKRCGARWTMKAQSDGDKLEARRLAGKRGFQAAVICAASGEAVLRAQELVTGGGQVLLFAHTRRGDEVNIDLSRICTDEKDLIGSYSSDFLLQKEAARWIFSRRLDVRKLVSHRFPLSQAGSAMRSATQPSPKSLKLLVLPSAPGFRMD